MSRPHFIIKTDSTDPVYREQLRTRHTQNQPGSSAVDLTDADVTFLMPIDDENMVNESASVTDAKAGDVEVQLPQGIPDGDYDAEFRVNFDNGDTLFWPQHQNLLVAVRAGTDRELDPADLSDPDASVTTLFVDTLQANSGDTISVQSNTNHGGNDLENVGSVSTENGDITSGRVGKRSLGPLQDATISTLKLGDEILLRPCIFPHEDGSTFTLIYRSSGSHGVSMGSVIKAVDSPDLGGSIENERTIVDNSGRDDRNMGTGVMANGRFGAVVASTDGTSYQAPKFVYSDDEGDTWSEEAISNVTNSSQLMEMHPYPASVGGDDLQGFICPGDDADLDDIRVWYTTDNGSTWDDSLVDTPTEDYLEPTIARVGNQDKWVMVVRHDDRENGQPGGVYTSTNLTDWTGPVEMNVTLGANRPKLIYDSGQFHLMTTNRMSTGGPIDEYGESVLIQRVDAEEVFDNPSSAWTDWEVIASGRQKCIGYPDVVEIGGAYYAAYVDGEDRDLVSSNLVLLSDAGGDSVPQMKQLFPGKDADRLDSERSFGEEFQNTSGRVKFVTIIVESEADGDTISVGLYSSTSSGAIDSGNEADQVIVADTTEGDTYSSTGLIMPGEYYAVASNADNDAVLKRWMERDISVP